MKYVGIKYMVEVIREDFGTRWRVSWNLHTVWGNCLVLTLFRAWRKSRETDRLNDSSVAKQKEDAE